MSKIYEESKKAGNALFKLAARLTGGVTEDVSNAGSRLIKRKQDNAKTGIDATTWDPKAKIAAKIGVDIIGGVGRMTTGLVTIIGARIKKQGEK
jgi:hypothetical protein